MADSPNRALEPRLRAHLGVMPVVVVTGARQTGKTTLARRLAPGPRRFNTLDDLDVLDAAKQDPDQLLGGHDAVTLDEIQRAPGLLAAIKRHVDDTRTAGRFLLTGSANLALMARVSESLAGRASYLTLWPMTRREQRGLGRRGCWDDLLAADDPDWQDVLARHRRLPTTGGRSRGVAASPIPPSTWRTKTNGQSGSTAICKRISNGTSPPSRPSRRWSTSEGDREPATSRHCRATRIPQGIPGTGACGIAAAHGRDRRMAGPRCACGALVAGCLTVPGWSRRRATVVGGV